MSQSVLGLPATLTQPRCNATNTTAEFLGRRFSDAFLAAIPDKLLYDAGQHHLRLAGGQFGETTVVGGSTAPDTSSLEEFRRGDPIACENPPIAKVSVRMEALGGPAIAGFAIYAAQRHLARAGWFASEPWLPELADDDRIHLIFYRAKDDRQPPLYRRVTTGAKNIALTGLGLVVVIGMLVHDWASGVASRLGMPFPTHDD